MKNGRNYGNFGFLWEEGRLTFGNSSSQMKGIKSWHWGRCLTGENYWSKYQLRKVSWCRNILPAGLRAGPGHWSAHVRSLLFSWGTALGSRWAPGIFLCFVLGDLPSSSPLSHTQVCSLITSCPWVWPADPFVSRGLCVWNKWWHQHGKLSSWVGGPGRGRSPCRSGMAPCRCATWLKRYFPCKRDICFLYILFLKIYPRY